VFSAWWFELFVGIGANYSYWYIASIIALDLFYVFSIGFFGMLTLIIPLVKWFTYWENRPDICTISACVLFYICFGFLLSFADKNETWGWWCVLKGFMIETTIIIGVCLFLFTIYLFSPETSVGKTTWGYLKGVKDRVCPLVKAPESFEKEKRDAMTNCGDG
jgi:energy-coupling factor transporter transmembrane protein EcfT